MLRKNVAAMLCLGVLALSAHTAHATGGSNYAKCLRTPLVTFNGTIAEAAVATPELSTLVTALTAADLVDALDGPGPFTVYAPTNAAFAAIPTGILDAVLANKDVLTEVLTYHVTTDEVDPRKALIPRQVSTLQGQTVFFNRDKSGPQINQSNIVDPKTNKTSCSGVRATNGIVWIINSVLQPQYF